MDKLTLLRELNKTTLKKSVFDKALEESGYSLPPADEMPLDDEDIDYDDENPEDTDIDQDDDYDDYDENLDDIEDTGLEDDEIQDIVDWCEDECSDMSNEELEDTLIDELNELDLSPDQLNATIAQVMKMLNRDETEDDDIETGDEYADDEIDDMDAEI